jgi:hypothetical protein
MGILSFAVTCWSALPINHPSVPFSEIAVITYGIGMLKIIGAQQFFAVFRPSSSVKSGTCNITNFFVCNVASNTTVWAKKN